MKTREHAASVTKEHKLFSRTEETCVSKNLDEMVRFRSDKRQEWIREIREKKYKGIAEGTNSAPRLASSSAVSYPNRNVSGDPL